VSESGRIESDTARDGSALARLEAARIWLPQPQAIQAVFFDVGFTLLDPYPSFPEAVRDILARQGAHVELACLEAALPAAEAQFVESARLNPHTWGNEQAISDIWSRYFRALLGPCLAHDDAALDAAIPMVQAAFDEATTYRLYPEVLPTLATLHRGGYKLGVISDWGASLSLILGTFELTRYFDFTVISATARRAKPDPALFQLALERADVTADYALHVGDSYVRDALGARQVGITPVLIDRTRSLSEGVPDCPLVYDVYEVLDLLDIPESARDVRPTERRALDDRLRPARGVVR
jgi:putative hydrolase of the HAD superfamily